MSPSSTALNGCLFFHSGCCGASALTRSSAKASWTYIGCSTHSVPSLSKVAMRCGGRHEVRPALRGDARDEIGDRRFWWRRRSRTAADRPALRRRRCASRPVRAGSEARRRKQDAAADGGCDCFVVMFDNSCRRGAKELCVVDIHRQTDDARHGARPRAPWQLPHPRAYLAIALLRRRDLAPSRHRG